MQTAFKPKKYLNIYVGFLHLNLNLKCATLTNWTNLDSISYCTSVQRLVTNMGGNYMVESMLTTYTFVIDDLTFRQG